MGDCPDTSSGSLEHPVARIPAWRRSVRQSIWWPGAMWGRWATHVKTLPMQWGFSSECRIAPRAIRAGPVTPMTATFIPLAGSRT